MYLTDSLRRLLEEQDRMNLMLDPVSAATRHLEELEYQRRRLEALSSPRLYMADSTIADIERTMRLRDAMTYPIDPALDANQPLPTFTIPPLRRLPDNMQLKKRVARLEREVEELKVKFNPPPPPPRK